MVTDEEEAVRQPSPGLLDDRKSGGVILLAGEHSKQSLVQQLKRFFVGRRRGLEPRPRRIDGAIFD